MAGVRKHKLFAVCQGIDSMEINDGAKMTLRLSLSAASDNFEISARQIQERAAELGHAIPDATFRVYVDADRCDDLISLVQNGVNSFQERQIERIQALLYERIFPTMRRRTTSHPI